MNFDTHWQWSSHQKFPHHKMVNLYWRLIFDRGKSFILAGKYHQSIPPSVDTETAPPSQFASVQTQLLNVNLALMRLAELYILERLNEYTFHYIFAT